MRFNLNSILRPNILNLSPYASARDEFSGRAEVYLDANENPFGTILGNAPYNRYPDPLQIEIKSKIASLEGITPQQIFLGNGSDEAIDLLIRAFCEPKEDEIILLPPTYGMYQVCAEVNNVRIKEVSLTPDFQIDTQAVLAAIHPQTKIIFLCSPNNPTGNLLKRAAVQQIIEDFSGIVVIDEAYADFSKENSWVQSLAQYPNLVVFKTFSKAWGMAGVRLGMAMASAAIIAVYNRIKYPYNINQLTQEFALKALAETNQKTAIIQNILQEREKLAQRLEKSPCVLKVYPSDANFLLVKVTQANEIYQYLVEKRVIVRNRSKVRLCDNCLRITVGTPAENETLLQYLTLY
jgi:histidinol-phosphate aminotransferase